MFVNSFAGVVWNFSAILGLSTFLFLFGYIVITILNVCLNVIKRKIYRYKYKHRFDKKPIAMCYCIDCRYRNDDKSCTMNEGKYRKDEWFCNHAIPK